MAESVGDDTFLVAFAHLQESLDFGYLLFVWVVCTELISGMGCWPTMACCSAVGIVENKFTTELWRPGMSSGRACRVLKALTKTGCGKGNEYVVAWQGTRRECSSKEARRNMHL